MVELAAAGHFANLERPTDFDDALEAFLQRHVAPPGGRVTGAARAAGAQGLERRGTPGFTQK